MEKLSIGLIITGAFKKGFKNSLAIFVNGLLWVITIWIPYLNVGTTIGLFFGIPAIMTPPSNHRAM